MYDFFRKERVDVFTTRFSPPRPPTNAWTLRDQLIFQAKGYNLRRTLWIKHKGRNRELTISVIGSWIVANLLGAKIYFIQEPQAAGILKKRNKKSVRYLVLSKLCEIHATSSRQSPLISGCAVDNFRASRRYPGCKLHLLLKHRGPFANPYVSGNEKEYFLIGQVHANDCEIIHYLGRTGETKNEIVNFPGSRIPRPTGPVRRVHAGPRGNSRIPRPSSHRLRQILRLQGK